MKNNKKKGFTLVELLVVIAILAILATVSVVGYTSFIERATVSNDENVATQLNQFLVALKADSNGPFYAEIQANGGKITADNVRKITDFILEDSGYGKNNLVPQAEKYGYHFYFDLEAQEYVVIGDKDSRILSMSPLGRLLAGAVNQSQTAYPESCFTRDGQYFLVETGTDLANLVAGFKTIEDAQGLDDYYNKVSDYKTHAKKSLVGLISLVKKTVFTTNNGHLIVDGTTGHEHLYVQEDLIVGNNNNHEKIGLTTKTPITVGDPLVTMQGEQVINLSLKDGVVLATYSWWFTNPENATLRIKGIANAAELATRVDIDFTNAKFILDDGNTYVFKDGTIKDVEGNTAAEVDEKNKVNGFTITTTPVTNKLVNDGTNLYVAYDHKSFTLSVPEDSFTGVLNNIISAENKVVTWSDNSDYLDINPVTGVVTLDNDLPTNDECNVVITATAGGYTKTLNVTIVKIKDANVTLVNGEASYGTFDMLEGGTITLTQNDNSPTTYTFNVSGISKDYDFPIDETLKVTTDEDTCFTITDNVLTLNPLYFEGEQDVTVSVGGSLVMTFTIKVIDNTTCPITVGLENYGTYLYRVGNQNEFTLGYLFEQVEGFEIKGDIQLTIKEAGALGTGIMSETTGFKVNDSEATLSKDAWKSHKVKFTGAGVAIISLKYGNYESIDIAVEVVNAHNIVAYGELSGKTNVVLLKDIEMSKDGLYTVAGNFYGNGFTFDVTLGKNGGSQDGIITVPAGTLLDNVKVIGDTFTTLNATTYADPYYTSAICLNGGTIANSYVYGCQSPVKTYAGEIINTTLEGGIYANLFIKQGSLTITDLTTINQTIAGRACGLGIVINENSSIVLNVEGTLTQYNWVSQTGDAGYFEGDAATLHSIMFMDGITFEHGGDKWVNTGILSLAPSATVNNYAKHGYTKVSNEIMGKTGVAYTIGTSSGYTFSGKPAAPEYVATKQTIYKPTISFDSNYVNNKVTDTSDHYVNVSGDKVSIGMNPATVSHHQTWEIAKLFAFTKYTNNNLVANYYVNGVAYTDSTITFSQSGVYTIRVELADSSFFDPNGGAITGTPIKYSKDITVVVVNTNAPSSKIECNTGSYEGIFFEQNKSAGDIDYYKVIPIIDNFSITYYTLNADGTDYVANTISAADAYASGKLTIKVGGKALSESGWALKMSGTSYYIYNTTKENYHNSGTGANWTVKYIYTDSENGIEIEEDFSYTFTAGTRIGGYSFGKVKWNCNENNGTTNKNKWSDL